MSKIWMMVSQDEYQLPLVVAESAEELARKTGFTAKQIRDHCLRINAGLYIKPKFISVEVEDD